MVNFIKAYKILHNMVAHTFCDVVYQSSFYQLFAPYCAIQQQWEPHAHADLGLSLPLEPEISPFLADFPPPLPSQPAPVSQQHLYPPQYHPQPDNYRPNFHASGPQHINPFQNTHVAPQPVTSSWNHTRQGNGPHMAAPMQAPPPHLAAPAVVRANLPDLNSVQRSQMSSMATSTAAVSSCTSFQAKLSTIAGPLHVQ